MTHGRAVPDAADAVRLLRRSGALVRVPVQGGSMRPLLADGDALRVLAGARPRGGDVVVALTGERLLVHRAVRVHRDTVVLCGDDTPSCDAPVAADRVLGRVVAVEGVRLRRLDGRVARAAGMAIATYARARAAAGDRPTRPRPARLAKLYMSVSDMWPPATDASDRAALALASPNVDGCRAAPASRLSGTDLDWQTVADRAWRGQIGPQAYDGGRRLLSGRDAPTVTGTDTGTGTSTSALEPLRRQYEAGAARNLRMATILGAMLERLDAVGIRAMGHKGVALLCCVYRDPALRIMGDIDLSVRDEERKRAEEAVADIRQSLERANPDRRSMSGYHVELDGTAHHDLDPAASGAGRWRAATLDWDGIWERAQSVAVAGHEMLVPCPTDLLLTLVANAVRRGCTPVRLVVDIAHTIDRLHDEIDWDALGAELQRTRLDRRSWVPLGLAWEWCGAVVPVRFLEPPADLRTTAYERLMLDWKRVRPFARLPTRVLWAGSGRGAASAVATLVRQRAFTGRTVR